MKPLARPIAVRAIELAMLHHTRHLFVRQQTSVINASARIFPSLASPPAAFIGVQ